MLSYDGQGAVRHAVLYADKHVVLPWISRIKTNMTLAVACIIFVKPAGSGRDIVVTTSVWCICIVCVHCACVHLFGFVRAITWSFVHGFQNN